jgi:phosphoglycolate phosphatase
LPLLYLAKKADTSVDNCLMIGDSKNDILSAFNSKMDSVGLSYGYNYNEDITEYNPTLVLNEFINLKKIL